MPPRASKLDDFKPIIDEILRADLDVPRKQRHTVTRIYDRLLAELGRLFPRTPWRTVAVGLTLVGLVCTMVQFGADIVEGLMAADRADMSDLSQQFRDLPGVELAFYAVGPQLFFVGLLALALLLAVARRLPWWSPVLMLVASSSRWSPSTSSP